LHPAATIFMTAIDLETSHPTQGLSLACCSWSGLGEILYEWNRVDEALDALLKGCSGSKKLGLSERITCDLALAKVWTSLGEIEKAEDLLGEYYKKLGTSSSLIRYENRLHSIWINLLAVQGKEREALQIIREHPIFEQEPLNPLQELDSMSIASAYYHLGEYEQCLNIAYKMVKKMDAGGRIGSMIKMLALITVSRIKLEDTQNALASLSEMIQLSVKDGFIRTYLDLSDPMFDALNLLFKSELFEKDPLDREYAAEIFNSFLSASKLQVPLKSFDAENSQNIPVSQLAFSILLTEHEKKVLRLLIAGQNNKDIGNELCISVNTVKTHVTNIYNKLKVHNRFQAAVRVNQLKIKL
jgi:LuxR family transcriptional regulator, maltose regulon positive regulatory protein